MRRRINEFLAKEISKGGFIYFVNLFNTYNLISDYMFEIISKYEKNNFIKKFIMMISLEK